MLTEPTIPQASTGSPPPPSLPAHTRQGFCSGSLLPSRLSCLISLSLSPRSQSTHTEGHSPWWLGFRRPPLCAPGPPSTCLRLPQARPCHPSFLLLPAELVLGGGAGASWVSLHPPLVCRPSHPLGEPGLLLLTTTQASPCLLRSCAPHFSPPTPASFLSTRRPGFCPSPQLPNSVLPRPGPLDPLSVCPPPHCPRHPVIAEAWLSQVSSVCLSVRLSWGLPRRPSPSSASLPFSAITISSHTAVQSPARSLPTPSLLLSLLPAGRALPPSFPPPSLNSPLPASSARGWPPPPPLIKGSVI